MCVQRGGEAEGATRLGPRPLLQRQSPPPCPCSRQLIPAFPQPAAIPPATTAPPPPRQRRCTAQHSTAQHSASASTAHLDGEGLAHDHVGVDDQHILLLDVRLGQPVDDGHRLVVGRVQVTGAGVVRVRGRDVGGHEVALRRRHAVVLLLGAAHDAGDRPGLPGATVAVKHACEGGVGRGGVRTALGRGGGHVGGGRRRRGPPAPHVSVTLHPPSVCQEK